jgi:predicted RNase H-like nuclease (RuvC/YqgF family)
MEEEKAQVEETETSELDALRQENDLVRSELKNRDGVITGLEQKLAEKDNEIAALKTSLEKAVQETAEKTEALGVAVAAYKALVMQANPGLVADMIKGDSIEGINNSAQSAQALVDRVKKELGAEDAKVKIPAGAPQRAPLDLGALSSREKIRYGMKGG